jgi:hypothetical protein
MNYFSITVIIVVVIAIATIAVVATKKIRELIEPFQGGTPLVESITSEEVKSIARPKSMSWPFAQSINYDSQPESLRFGYNDNGVHIEYEIREGRLFYNTNKEGWNPFVPTENFYNCPERFIGRPTAVSFDRSRQGEWDCSPEFDMIAASSDRVFAKAKNISAFYISLPSQVYLHQSASGQNIVLPQSLFKLDPQIGLNNVDDIITPHLKVENDNERHLATNRFPLFRSVFRFLNAYESIKPIRDLFPNMVVQVHPYAWLKMDFRPPIGGIDVPEIFPTQVTAVYQTPSVNISGLQITFPRKEKKSIRYRTVLDLGVGMSHLNEQYDDLYGGEMDVINNPIMPIVRSLMNLLNAPASNFQQLYSKLNGPIQDVGGWVDGTCLYFILVELDYTYENPVELDMLPNSQVRQSLVNYNRNIQAFRSRKSQQANGVNEIEITNSDFTDAYAILWVDEQLTFTNRWRALDIRDGVFPEITRCMVSSLSEPTHSFSSSEFFNPFEKGRLRSFSRMAIARQAILVNGFNSDCGEHEIYSIHFSWPTMDKTWRTRSLPALGQIHSLGEMNDNCAFVDTLHIREDMTISMRGCRNGETGYWVQKFLPASNQETPHGSIHKYAHKWTFYGTEAFEFMNSRYRFFGVFQSVNSRCQFYDVKVDSPQLNPQDHTWGTIETAIAQHKATISRKQLDYEKAAQVVDSLISGIPIILLITLGLTIWMLYGVATLNLFSIILSFLLIIILLLGGGVIIGRLLFPERTKPSLYEDKIEVRFKNMGNNRLIMLYADKREDKNVSLDGVGTGKRIILKRIDGDELISVSLTSHSGKHGQIKNKGLVTAPEVDIVIVSSSFESTGKLESLKISFKSARNLTSFDNRQSDFLNWIDLNIDRVKAGYIKPDGTIHLLFDLNRSDSFLFDSSTEHFSFSTIFGNEGNPIQEPNINFNEESQANLGLSIWFEGITGLVNTAEKIIFK